MGTRTYRSGSATVTVSGLDTTIARARGPLIPVSTEVTRGHLLRVLTAAQEVWPVRTGRSRDGLDLRTEQRGSVTRTAIVGEVPYTARVHRRGDRALVWETLVVAPVMASRLEVEASLRAALEREIQREVAIGR